jgi:spore coat polysaccharide biosynthesis protein SpsF
VRVVAIVQARMGSTRLPGKVLRQIGTKTMLARVVQRMQRASTLDEVVVATTTQADDEAIVAECGRLGVPVFRGDEQDVLDRYWQTARAHQAQAVVRITSDCPLIEPEVIDRVVEAFLHAAPDYASNTLERSYPRGLDTEVVALSALERAWREATKSYQRVHVTPYLYQHPELFKLLSVTNDVDRSNYRWTVDTLEDLAFVQEVYERLGDDGTMGWTEVLDLLAREPALVELNRQVQQKALQDG